MTCKNENLCNELGWQSRYRGTFVDRSFCFKDRLSQPRPASPRQRQIVLKKSCVLAIMRIEGSLNGLMEFGQHIEIRRAVNRLQMIASSSGKIFEYLTDSTMLTYV